MPSIATLPSACWIIGYGNSHRRDDGIGPYVVGQVGKSVNHKKEIQTMELHQLEPSLIEDLQHAKTIIFVDAVMDVLDDGWKWVKIEPEFRGFYHVTHLFKPPFLLGLLQALYQKSPETWLVTIQGDNFDFGEGLTPKASKRAGRATSEILDFLDKHHCQGEIICNHITEGG